MGMGVWVGVGATLFGFSGCHSPEFDLSFESIQREPQESNPCWGMAVLPSRLHRQGAFDFGKFFRIEAELRSADETLHLR